MAAAIAQRLGRLERAVAAAPPCPACAVGPRLLIVGCEEPPEPDACALCGRELEAILFEDPYAPEKDGDV